MKVRVTDGENPRDIKFLLAREIVARFHDEAAAERAQQDFISRHRHGRAPDRMPEVVLNCPDATRGIAYVLRDCGLVASTSEAIRMINQGAVRVDGNRISDPRLALEANGLPRTVQVGKAQVCPGDTERRQGELGVRSKVPRRRPISRLRRGGLPPNAFCHGLPRIACQGRCSRYNAAPALCCGAQQTN